MKRLPFLVVALLFLVAPLLAREVPVSEIRLGTPPGERTLPSIAEGRGGYLAAWVDERHGVPMVFAARINNAGVPLDRHGIALGSGHDSSRPQVIWNGAAWLVFWSSPDHALMMASVDSNGRASTPQRIADWAPPERGRWVATNGSVIVAAHGGSSWGNAELSKVYATTLTMEGAVIESRILDTRPASTFTVVANDSGFAIAWNVLRLGGPFDLDAVRLNERGELLDTAPRNLARGERLDEFVRNNDGYVVVTSHFTTEGPRYESFAVNASLEVVSAPAPLAIGNQDTVVTAFDDHGQAVLVIEEADGNLSHYTAIRFSEDGRERGRQRFVTSANELGALAIVRTTPGFTAAWIALQQPATWKLEGAIFDTELAPLTPERGLTETAPAEGAATVAAGANEMLVAFREPAGVRLRRITYDGERLDLDGVVLTDVAEGVPEIVFDGTRYAIAYISGVFARDMVVVRFLENGVLLDDAVQIQVDSYSRDVAIARGRASTVVGWVGDEGVHAATIEGTRLAAVPRIVAPGFTASLSIAFNGSHYLFAWQSGFLDWDMILYDKIVGRRFVENLVAAESEPTVLLEKPLTGASALEVAARSNGEFVLAFDNNGKIDVMRIGANLHVLKHTTVATGSEPRVASEGDNVTLAWTSNDHVLRAAPLTEEGTLAADGIAVGAPLPGFFNFGITSDLALRHGQTILVYARRAIEAGNIPRVFVTIEGQEARPPRRRAVR
jgi:hypothetical protein